MNWTVRFLFALAFVAFCAASIPVAITWDSTFQPVPRWLPVAAALAVPTMIAVVLLILEGPSVFTKKDSQ